ncbi:MAG: GntP family permease [Oscillospiraceae bacterium]|nr:GntP family permease [Oscillospiraceae bacterium]
MNALAIIGLIVAMVLMVVLAMKGIHVLAIALICSAILAATSGLNVYNALAEQYMPAFSNFVTNYFLIFLSGSLFGSFMAFSHASDAIANWIVKKMGPSKAPLAVILSGFVLTYGGVSVHVVCFTLFPLALSIFKEADLPRSMLPGTLAFGTITFAMTTPGTPQIQNLIPAQALGTSPTAGAVVGIIAGVFMFVVGYIMIKRMFAAREAKGEHYDAREGDMVGTIPEEELPNVVFSFIPLILTIVLLNFAKLPVFYAILISIVVGMVLMRNTFSWKRTPAAFADGAGKAIIAICNTSAVVGFGGVMKSVPLFTTITNAMAHIPGPALVGAALAVTIICGLCGSASGGLGIALPIVGPQYIEMGVAPAALHRVCSIASGALDSVPHNGFVVTLLTLCGETHKDAYMPIFWLTVVLPFAATALAIGLFQMFPGLP